MKAQRRWSIAGTIFTLAAGALLHFTYQWFGGIFWAAVGAVNESTWEHLKLLFFPALLFLLVEYLISGRPSEGFFPATLLALLCGMGAITVLFYTYTGILGYHTMIADLAIFAIATALTFWLSYRWWVSPPRWFCKTWGWPVLWSLPFSRSTWVGSWTLLPTATAFPNKVDSVHSQAAR